MRRWLQPANRESRACIANCGPYDWGQVLPKMPPISQEVFRVRSHAKTMDEAYTLAKKITLEGAAERITCPLLVVFGAGDRLIAPSEGERLAKAAKGPSELVIYEEGNHVCFNISYKFRPLTARLDGKTVDGLNESHSARFQIRFAIHSLPGNHNCDVQNVCSIIDLAAQRPNCKIGIGRGRRNANKFFPTRADVLSGSQAPLAEDSVVDEKPPSTCNSPATILSVTRPLTGFPLFSPASTIRPPLRTNSTACSTGSVEPSEMSSTTSAISPPVTWRTRSTMSSLLTSTVTSAPNSFANASRPASCDSPEIVTVFAPAKRAAKTARMPRWPGPRITTCSPACSFGVSSNQWTTPDSGLKSVKTSLGIFVGAFFICASGCR